MHLTRQKECTLAPSRRVRRRVEKDRTAILEERLAHMESLLYDRHSLGPPADGSPAISSHVVDVGPSPDGHHVTMAVQSIGRDSDQSGGVSRPAGMVLGHPFSIVRSHMAALPAFLKRAIRLSRYRIALDLTNHQNRFRQTSETALRMRTKKFPSLRNRYACPRTKLFVHG